LLQYDTSSSSVRIAVTCDFGKTVLLERVIEVEGTTTALDALRQVAKVETKYGGGFVSDINGISTQYAGTDRKKGDWFCYINGISTNTGAGAYILQDGDTEHWDFRDWGFQSFVPATIGSFPEPFRHGYGGAVYPTTIVYQNGCEESAMQIADKLGRLGVASVSTRNISQLSAEEKATDNLILLALPDCQLIAEMNQVWDRLGFYIHLQDGNLTICNSAGEATAEYTRSAGFIQATQNPWNPQGTGACQNVVWVVSGTDETGIETAVTALLNQHSDFTYAYGVVLANGVIIEVPQC
jgi:hypothetical protein